MKTTNDYSIVFLTFFDNGIDLIDINHTHILKTNIWLIWITKFEIKE